MKMRTECDGRVRFYRIPLDFLQKEWMYRGVMLRIMSPGRFCLQGRAYRFHPVSMREAWQVCFVRSFRNSKCGFPPFGRATAGRERVRHSEPERRCVRVRCVWRCDLFIHDFRRFGLFESLQKLVLSFTHINGFERFHRVAEKAPKFRIVTYVYRFELVLITSEKIQGGKIRQIKLWRSLFWHSTQVNSRLFSIKSVNSLLLQ